MFDETDYCISTVQPHIRKSLISMYPHFSSAVTFHCVLPSVFVRACVRAWFVMASGRDDKIVNWHEASTELRVLKNIILNLS